MLAITFESQTAGTDGYVTKQRYVYEYMQQVHNTQYIVSCLQFLHKAALLYYIQEVMENYKLVTLKLESRSADRQRKWMAVQKIESGMDPLLGETELQVMRNFHRKFIN